MSTLTKTIFDSILDDFFNAIEGDPKVPDPVAARLRQLASNDDLKIETIRNAVINDSETQL